ncbi:uncharacterized protein LOC126770602 [Nymphalis io]|uniref:uncharacterized protein LOC126770602 n=1 Tax=Inachis io TaxID=171585 RepID=UPI002169FEC5|nr:uncharacterized protein LOC126770602 [Nymphalis io]
MSSHWTNENAILRDLSVAQGREVPAEIVNPVGSNEKPPALNYTEETEEEYFTGCVGSGDFETGPDIQLIQHMLNLVREVSVTDIEDKGTDHTKTIVEITKSNPNVSQGTSAGLESILKSDVKKNIKKPKKKRNVAVASLIEKYGDNMYTNEDNIEIQVPSTKLLKPDDFIPDLKDISTECSSNSESVYKTIPMIQSTTSMFKKKSPNRKSLGNTSTYQKEGHSSMSMTTENDISLDKYKPGNFVPSSHAGERYKEYLERSKLKEIVKEDVWTKAERLMKDIDSKRKQECFDVESPTTSSQDVHSLEAKGMDFVRLPQHRHLLTGDCTVCKVLCTHNKEQLKDIHDE